MSSGHDGPGREPHDPLLERPFYTVAGLAARLAISERTLRDMLNRDEIPWYRIGAQRRIDPVDVERWLADRKHER